MLLAGTDELGYLLGKTAEIDAWEAAQPGPRRHRSRPADGDAARAALRNPRRRPRRLAAMNTTPLARLALPVAPRRRRSSLTIAACSSARGPVRAESTPTAARQSEQPAPTDPDSSVAARPTRAGGGGIDATAPAIVVAEARHDRPAARCRSRQIEPSIDGRHVTVKLTWTSGVEPCYVLDSVMVVPRTATPFDLTVVEGTGRGGAICIEIAQQKATIVDLGELEPGDYTISATDSDIPPVTITVV